MNTYGAITVTALFLAALSTPTHGQAGPVGCAPMATLSDALAAPLPAAVLCDASLDPEVRPPAVAKAFLYSLVIPGAGQKSLGQKRGLAYIALEAFAWIEFARARSDGGDLRNRYRTLGWDVARTFRGPRVDGDFAYYEALTKFTRSGSFDMDPNTPGLQPESDRSTFNGNVWSLATELFFAPGTTPAPGDPNFERALEFYRKRGYGDQFLWDWTGNEAERARYKDLIRDSDSRFRRSSVMAGVVLANHLVSAIDAFLSARVRAATNGIVVTHVRAVPVGISESRLDVGFSILH
ncbi:MAG: hypothetical protein BMS9Abin29_1276 [Gemmatimonadota bacterium]|nr:MAG: hypothetical protein BMS9Abin29_1276 [Gemmatimonadota bacterium]